MSSSGSAIAKLEQGRNLEIKKEYTKIFFIKVIMTRIRAYTPLKLEGRIFGFK